MSSHEPQVARGQSNSGVLPAADSSKRLPRRKSHLALSGEKTGQNPALGELIKRG